MSDRNSLKTRLAGEVATVVFGDDDVPSAAWDRLDRLIEDVFGEAATGRLRTLVDDAGEVNACGGRIESSGSVGFKGSVDDDWDELRGVVEEALRTLDPRRNANDDDEASGARTLELVRHGDR
jgi:hypothetical protein